ncbi:2-(1,2-epoxy-1,2-dihydrophenyl)acetyl-CoA isomerase [Roseovarius sp. TE539]|uniref:enoyl-CoA hydratase-related protein n=1 Tax=Roseovarius sp. TE539 TaxID=2249812 RepID=UPI000DDE34B5|nr:enoyl-CoA hydratase-related protein [Roseovarius sp. TE539]RBI72708.1 2-(1,2-epoxy-1,2-dihydrophenyl)acetyl-CoA isomerase [Roseovarius sp. TE539]
MKYQDITVETDGPVATLTVNRPDKLNAMRNETADDLRAAFAALEGDDTIRAVVMTGAGRAFGAGYDLSTVDLDEGCELGPVLENHFNPLVRTIRRSRLIVISAVNGPCAGVNVGLALAADIVLAADNAFFYEPFAGIALVPDGGNTLFIPRVAGRVRALSMMLLGEKIAAAQAREWGLVWAVHPAESLLAEARAAADRIAALPPLAAQRTKQLVTAATEDALDTQLDLERDYQAELSGTPEMIAAMSKFVG